ncbi:hypothetical protein KUL113_64940 [Tenacibaculum sp. KUL113]|nr:hypothetical protein KUL113_64940 [Tenacibaculum sp. KUL113]
MPISKPHSTLGATNTGSCSDLALYLEKENHDLDKLLLAQNSPEAKRNIEARKQFFFSHNEQNISTNEAINSIDTNIKKLGKNDAKYFAPTISFSQEELKHILSIISKNEEIKDIWQLNTTQHKEYNRIIIEYARKVMTNYAVNFNRQEKGLISGDDLVYFGKVEHFRKFKGTDEEVIKGDYKAGDLKPGINTHVHIIVSRKCKNQRLKLTPTTKERKTDRSIGGNKYRVGFDRMQWINTNEATFDVLFNYKRKELEKFQNQYILKNGSPKEIKKLKEHIKLKETLITKENIHEQKNTHHTSKGWRR